MYFLFTDETNTIGNIGRGVKFFVYGGLVIPPGGLEKLHNGIALIRDRYGFNSSDDFKFDTNTRPSQVTLEDFTKAKNEMLDLCIELDCKLISYVVLHKIAKNKKLSEHIFWGANSVIKSFNDYLFEIKGRGAVMIDRVANKKEYDYIVEKFTKGLPYQTGTTISLDNIILFASTCNNASHGSSAMDIILGAFRYCINSPSNTSAARSMMEKLVKLIWADKLPNGDLQALEKGLIFRPTSISVPEYKKEYDDLLSSINSLLE